MAGSNKKRTPTNREKKLDAKRGVGKPNSGLRSVLYVVAWACMFLTGLMALVAAF